MPRPGIAIIARLMVAAMVSSLAFAVTPSGRAVESLKNVRDFLLAGGGFGGPVSSEERAFRAFMKQNPTAEDALSLISEGTPAAKIYALVALKKISPLQFAAMAPRFLSDPKKVRFQMGCLGGETTTGFLVRLISSDKFVLHLMPE